jgi:hypothetical protein
MGRREEVEAALDAAAEGLAGSTGATRESAYAKLLGTEAGREASAMIYDEESARSSPRPMRSAADAVAKCAPLEERLDELAREEASRTGEGFAKCYGRALRSPEGRALYARIVELLDGARG